MQREALGWLFGQYIGNLEAMVTKEVAWETDFSIIHLFCLIFSQYIVCIALFFLFRLILATVLITSKMFNDTFYTN